MKILRYLILFGFMWAAFAGLAYAESSIALKLVVVNPSQEQTQPAVVKSYLPREVQPDDVLSKGDLQIVYDAQQGSYYAYGEFELKPAEVLEQEITLRDIWRIPDAEIESVRAEAVKDMGLSQDTEFADRVAFLCKGVIAKLDQIRDGQIASPANPELHISGYRENLKTMDSAKADLAAARSMLSQARPFSAGAVWGMILAIVIFLGLLGGSFYFVWYRQVRKAPVAESAFYVPPGDVASQTGPTPRDSGQKKREEKDVDQLLKEGQ